MQELLAMLTRNHDLNELCLITLAGLYAGTQNTLAGGGSFITFPALLLAGLDPLAANITSTIALYPNQVASAAAGRKVAAGAGKISLLQLFALSVGGGIAGAMLLLSTPVIIFSRLVPWLVCLATAIFIWGCYFKKPHPTRNGMHPIFLAVLQFLIGVYGGYFGGGIGILMLSALTLSGQAIRVATASKNVLAMAMNTSAVSLFAFSSQIDWPAAFALSMGGVGGAITGSWLLHRLPEKIMRGFVVLVGISLTVWLFWRQV